MYFLIELPSKESLRKELREIQNLEELKLWVTKAANSKKDTF